MVLEYTVLEMDKLYMLFTPRLALEEHSLWPGRSPEPFEDKAGSQSHCRTLYFSLHQDTRKHL